jgi:uncharacterized protein
LARIILLLAIAFAVYLLVRGFTRPKAGDPGAQGPREAEDMVACARCGVNMPRSEAKEEGGRFTCRDPSTCKHAQ